MRDPACRRASSRGATRTRWCARKTLYDVAHERGMTTAQVDWVAILERADRHVGVSRAPGTRRARSRRSSSRPASSPRPSSRRSRPGTSSGAITSGPGRRAHHPAAPAEPDDVPPAQPRLHAAPLRSAHARGDGDHGAPRCAGAHASSSGRAGRPDGAHDLLRRLRSRVQAGQASDPAERGVHAGGPAHGAGWKDSAARRLRRPRRRDRRSSM